MLKCALSYLKFVIIKIPGGGRNKKHKIMMKYIFKLYFHRVATADPVKPDCTNYLTLVPVDAFALLISPKLFCLFGIW